MTTIDQTQETVLKDLRNRPAPKRIDLDSLYECDPKDYIGYFADSSHYDTLIQEDCDVYVAGVKVIAFRKSLFPRIKDKDPGTWEYLRWAARDMYSGQRGLAAGRELVTNMESRITNGLLNFFKAAKEGKVTTVEEAQRMIAASPDRGQFLIQIGSVKKDYPEIGEQVKAIDAELRKKTTTPERREELLQQKYTALFSWVDPWLKNDWANAEDKVALAKAVDLKYIGKQNEANKVHSNIMGIFDRNARNPYGRLSATTLKDYDGFVRHQDIYQTASVALKECLNDAENPRWDLLNERFGKVRDPHYNLFGTVFTTLTLNWNFRTAFHYDGNNCEGGIAVLTAMTKGDYDGHYLVFPEIRCAFDLRDGDFIAGDNQGMIHGNTAMIPRSLGAERVSLVFYSRERVTMLDDLECEACRKDFMKFAVENHPQFGKGKKTWNGVFPGMWGSSEWKEYKKSVGMEHCSNTTYWCTPAEESD
jgi:hypothetical protein